MAGNKDQIPTGSLLIAEQVGAILSDIAPSLLATIGDVAVAGGKTDTEWVTRLQVATARARSVLAEIVDQIQRLPTPEAIVGEPEENATVTDVTPEVNARAQAAADNIYVPGTKVKLAPELFNLYTSVKALVGIAEAEPVSVEDVIYAHYDVDEFSDEAKALVTKYLNELVRRGLISYDEESQSYRSFSTRDPKYADRPVAVTTTFLTKGDIELRPADPAVFTERLVTAIKTIIAQGNGGTEMRLNLLAPRVRDGLETDDATTDSLLRQLAATGLGYIYKKRGREFYATEKPEEAQETPAETQKREAREKDQVFTDIYKQIAIEVFDVLAELEREQGIEMKKLWARSSFKERMTNVQFNAVLRRLESANFIILYRGKGGRGYRSKNTKVQKAKFINHSFKNKWDDQRAEVTAELDELIIQNQANTSDQEHSGLSTE